MALKTRITDGSGHEYEAKVTPYGQLVTAPLDYSVAYNAVAGTANTAANFLGPRTNQRFVITSILLYANQGVSNTADATVVIYEASSPTTTTVDTTVISTNMIRQDRVTLANIHLITAGGKWINLKTTDDDVYGTIFGYYVPVV